ELAHAARAHAELRADCLERGALAVAGEAEAKLEDPPLVRGQLGEGAANRVPAERLRGLLGRIGGGRIHEQVAQLTLLAGAHGPVQGNRRLGGVERLLHVLKGEAGSPCNLLPRRLAAQLSAKHARRARASPAPLVDMRAPAVRPPL